MDKSHSKKKDLEETLKEKIVPLLEETMERSIGVRIPKIETDITDQLRQPHLDIYVPCDLSFAQAKKHFKKQFLERELQIHLGNITQLAKVLEIDRRSIHRVIKELEIDVDHVRDVHEASDAHTMHYAGIIGKTIRSTLAQYKEIIHPHKMQRMYGEVPKLSRNIVKFVPHQDVTWKQAEREFEKEFLKRALDDANGNVAKAAATLDIRSETLHRKIKKLGLRN